MGFDTMNMDRYRSDGQRQRLQSSLLLGSLHTRRSRHVLLVSSIADFSIVDAYM